MRFFRRNRNVESGTKSVHQIAKEIRMQKIQEHAIKVAAAKAAAEENANDLLLNVDVPDNTKPTPILVNDDAVTDTNSPGNSDNDDPTINDDDDDDEEEDHDDNNTQQQQHDETNHNNEQPSEQQLPMLPGSPLSVLSMNTKPVLIHPPRSIHRVEDGDNETPRDDNDTTTTYNNPLGVLCGCI